MKILIDCHVFDQTLQGTTTYIKGLYNELIKNKEITFYFISYKSDMSKVFGHQENIVYLKYKSKNKFYRLLIDLPLIIKRNKIDYAHFQYVIPPLESCKYIVTIHDVLFLDYPEYFPFLYKFSKKILFKWSAKRANLVLTVSEFSKERIQHFFKIQSVYITPNAVDKVFFETYDKLDVAQQVALKFNFNNYFLFVSRWEPRKNHHFLLKTFVINNYYKDYNLVFIGSKAIEDSKFSTYYKNLNVDIKSKIHFLEKINFEDLLLLNRAATLSIYPSIAEGFGIPPLESIACNVPTICSYTTAMKEFDFLKNYMFNPLSESELKEKIDFALTENDFNLLKEQVQKKYNWNISAEEFIKAVSKKE